MRIPGGRFNASPIATPIGENDLPWVLELERAFELETCRGGPIDGILTARAGLLPGPIPRSFRPHICGF